MIRRPSLPLVALALGLSACTGSRDGGDDRRLSLQLNSEPVTLDPSRVEDGLAFRVITNLMDGLTGFTNEGTLIPRLAEAIEPPADGKTWRFRIRPDAKWSDGVPVDASQFKLAIERALRPETGSKLSGLLKWIEGADAFSKGKATGVSGIVADGAKIEFRLVKPISFFDQVLALPIAYPLRKDVLDAHGGRWDTLRGKDIPTVGAYRVKSYLPDQEILFEAARAVPAHAPKEVLLRIIVDESTGSTLFDQKRLDVLTRIPAFDQERYEKQGIVKVVPFQATYFFSFNRKKKPFDKPEFRRAFAAAIRKHDIVRILGTGEIPASAWVARGQEGYYEFKGDAEGRDLALASAREKGRALGWKGEIRIGFDVSGRNTTVAEKVQADLKSEYGWPSRLRNMEWKSYVRSIYSDPEMVFRFGWSSPMIDPAVHLLPFTTNDPFSFTGYSNPRYDRLIDEIVGMKPSPERERKIVEAQKILIEEDCVVVPVYHYVSTYAVGPRVSKFRMNPLGYSHFEEIELK
jgi:oligopeptide transport system substrate-binding protein